MEADNFFWPIFMDPDHLNVTPKIVDWPNLLPEHTYGVVPRDFLCNCPLDLEHASVLHQLSSCHHNASNKLVMEFVVNIAFYEILRQHKLNWFPKLDYM